MGFMLPFTPTRRKCNHCGAEGPQPKLSKPLPPQLSMLDYNPSKEPQKPKPKQPPEPPKPKPKPKQQQQPPSKESVQQRQLVPNIKRNEQAHAFSSPSYNQPTTFAEGFVVGIVTTLLLLFLGLQLQPEFSKQLLTHIQLKP
jgi:hypothetical protein